MMNALQQFAAAVALPDQFGQALPYVRYAYTDPGQQAGADADVEFRKGGDGNTVVVTVSEWRNQVGGRTRSTVITVVFSVETGELFDNAHEDPMETLLGATMGMRRLGDEATA
jgi:hypothetical protein